MNEMPGTIPAKPEQALDEINDRHPVIAQKLAEMEAARANVDNAKSQYSPTVNVSYGKQTTQGSGQGDYIAQLTVNMPIFSGGSTVGAVDQAAGQLRALEFEVKEARLTQREKLLAAWSDWKTAKERSKIGKGQSATGQSVVDSYLKQFMIGKRSLLDVLNVQADQFSYQSNAVIASYDEKAYRARVLAAMGKLAISYQARQTQKKPG
jgi:adhesin transport system outer membrane protein